MKALHECNREELAERILKNAEHLREVRRQRDGLNDLIRTISFENAGIYERLQQLAREQRATLAVVA